MKESGAKFRKTLKYCRENKSLRKSDKMLEKFLSNGRNSKEIYRKVHKSKHVMPNHPCAIDGICDTNGIVNVFSSKYKNVLDNLDCHISYNRGEPYSP